MDTIALIDERYENTI